MLRTICISASYAYSLNTSAGSLLLGQELAVAIDELRSVVGGQAIGKYAPFYEVLVIAIYQMLVIALSRQRCKLLSAGAATCSEEGD